MPFPTITEQDGARSGTGMAVEAKNAFGVPVAAIMRDSCGADEGAA